MGVAATQDSTSEWRKLGAQVTINLGGKHPPLLRGVDQAAELAETGARFPPRDAEGDRPGQRPAQANEAV